MQTHPAFDAAIAGAARQLDQRYGAIFDCCRSLFIRLASFSFQRVCKGLSRDSEGLSIGVFNAALDALPPTRNTMAEAYQIIVAGRRLAGVLC